MNKATKGKDNPNAFRGGFKDPFKSNSYVDPFKTSKDYKDPLRIPKGSYIDPIKARKIELPEFHPYDTFHEYKLPDIDPLTGKPYRKGGRVRKAKKQEEPKKTKEPVPKSFFPAQFGSTVGSTKRMLRIQDHLNF